MERRVFLGLCAGAAALTVTPSAFAANRQPKFYTRALLVYEDGQPVAAGRLRPRINYVFHYPFVGTPCFLVNLGIPAKQETALKASDGSIYRWGGGVGPGSSIVSYSAICAHRLAYPTKQISFISFRDGSTPSHFARKNMIHCCSEHSEYDPSRGARVVGGPAKQPLAAILLEHEVRTDRLYAVGTLGGEMFDEFFKKYAFRLATEFGGNTDAARKPVGETAVVMELGQYCKQQVNC